MRASRLSVIVGAAAIIAGCNPFTGACTTELRYGLNVEVRDAVTGAPAADGARLIARDGDYVETVEGPPIPGMTFLQAAGERPGRYTVTIQKTGYQDWTRDNVWVRDGGCHVATVRFEARLQPVQQ
jgi:hypothetical protein